MIFISSYGITGTAVRLEVGIGTGDISDANMNVIIDQAERETDRLLNCTFTPKRITERHITPNKPSFVMLRKTPVTRVVNIQMGGTGGSVVNPEDTVLDPETGKLLLRNTAAKTQFDDDEEDGNVINYYYAKMEEDTGIETSLSAAPGTGSDVVLTVGTGTGIALNDYVKVVGHTGISPEITKVTSVGDGTFSADLSLAHENGSRIVRMQTHSMAQELTRILAGIMCAINMIGATYTFATSYSFPEHTITKGVPYPHFEKVLGTLVKKRDYILKRMRPQSAIY